MRIDPTAVAELRCFEVAAQHMNFTKAGDALGLTQSAVSQRIRNLEKRLGYPLFLRQYRSIALTEAGTVLFDSTARAFLDIEQTLDRLEPSEAVLQVNCIPSLALEWLMPRLVRFSRLQPKIAVRLKAEFQTLNRQSMRIEGIELAIRYEPDDDANRSSEPVLTEYILPVATPKYLAEHPNFAAGHSLDEVTLLHDATPWMGAPKFVEWRSWLESARPDWLDHIGGVEFNLSSLAVGAALNHQGVAMARTAMVTEAIQSGRLINVFGRLAPAPARYTLLAQNPRDRRSSAFTDWLKEECARFAEERKSTFPIG